MLRNIVDLYDYIVGDCSNLTESQMLMQINRRVYKDTECGCCFNHLRAPERVWLSGYVEGWDGECPVHELTFPFSEREWDEALKAADKEGCDMFDLVHTRRRGKNQDK